MVTNLEAVRAAVVQAKALAAEFRSATVRFYEDGNTTPVIGPISCRVKKPKPSSFDAGNQTEWSTKRLLEIKVGYEEYSGPIRKGLIAQVETPDGDPTINNINFIVQSSLGSQFSAERSVSVATEVAVTPRIS